MNQRITTPDELARGLRLECRGSDAEIIEFLARPDVQAVLREMKVGTPAEDELQKHLQTEQEMHAAWRKRAEEAEAESASLRKEKTVTPLTSEQRKCLEEYEQAMETEVIPAIIKAVERQKELSAEARSRVLANTAGEPKEKTVEEESFWLVEFNYDVGPKHTLWWIEHDVWTPIASDARRFISKSEAQATVLIEIDEGNSSHKLRHAIITEHMFCTKPNTAGGEEEESNAVELRTDVGQCVKKTEEEKKRVGRMLPCGCCICPEHNKPNTAGGDTGMAGNAAAEKSVDQSSSHGQVRADTPPAAHEPEQPAPPTREVWVYLEPGKDRRQIGDEVLLSDGWQPVGNGGHIVLPNQVLRRRETIPDVSALEAELEACVSNRQYEALARWWAAKGETT